MGLDWQESFAQRKARSDEERCRVPEEERVPFGHQSDTGGGGSGTVRLQVSLQGLAPACAHWQSLCP